MVSAQEQLGEQLLKKAFEMSAEAAAFYQSVVEEVLILLGALSCASGLLRQEGEWEDHVPV